MVPAVHSRLGPMFHPAGQDGRPLQLTGRKWKIESIQIRPIAFCQQLSDHCMHALNCRVVASQACSSKSFTFQCDVFGEPLSYMSSECSMQSILIVGVDRFYPCITKAHALESFRRFEKLEHSSCPVLWTNKLQSR